MMEHNRLTSKELYQLVSKYKTRRRNLIVLCLVFTVAFLVVEKFLDGLGMHSVIQGFYLGTTFVFVSLISEADRKIQGLKRGKAHNC